MSNQRVTQGKEALQRCLTSTSIMNYEKIINDFAEKGVPAENIIPRENIFTYNIWKTLNRQVRKGEKGVKITVYVEKEIDVNGKKIKEKYPRNSTVFHVSQTDLVILDSKTIE